jgi:hypothetical protein
MPASAGICVGEGDAGVATVGAADAAVGGTGCGTWAGSAGVGVGSGAGGVAAVGGAGDGTGAGGAGVGVGSGAGVVGCADCGVAAISAGGGVGVGAGDIVAGGAGVVSSAGTFPTDGAEVCGAIGCSLSLWGQKAKPATNNIPTDSATNQVFVLIAPPLLPPDRVITQVSKSE